MTNSNRETIIQNNLPLIQQTGKGNPMKDRDLDTGYSPFLKDCIAGDSNRGRNFVLIPPL
ncbi:MAG TPA: hypothetical protein PKI55_10250 [Chitinophagaceae bacterium]|nr:hypothetical protein [Chitinophagaceae bacterium]